MQRKKTTIHEVAKALNTTASTVSRALNNHPRISDKTKQRVLEMAQSLGYEPNAVASSLRKGRSNLVGIIVPYADRAIFATVVRGIEEEVKKQGFNVIICQSYEKFENEVEDVNALLNAQVAGIILSLSKETKKFDHLQKVLSENKPLILFDRSTEKLRTCSVVIDDFQGAYQSVKHLAEQGYKKIAFFSGDRSVSVFSERYRGYKTALNDLNLEFNPNFVIQISSDVDDGYQAMTQLMSYAEQPDAICSASDWSALGAINWLNKNGFEIPQDFGVAGFSNEPFTQYLEKSLTSVDQKSKLMGQMAAKVFIDQISSGADNVARKIVLTPELVVRKSSSRIVMESTLV